VSVQEIPLSARFRGQHYRAIGADDVVRGADLSRALNAVDVSNDTGERPFRFQVQWVNRPNGDFRGFSGTVISGAIAPGDKVLVAGSPRCARLKEIVTFDGILDRAREGEAVTPVFDRHRARRSFRKPRRAARMPRSVRRACNLDERPRSRARPLLSDEDRQAHRGGDRHLAQAPHRC